MTGHQPDGSPEVEARKIWRSKHCGRDIVDVNETRGINLRVDREIYLGPGVVNMRGTCLN